MQQALVINRRPGRLVAALAVGSMFALSACGSSSPAAEGSDSSAEPQAGVTITYAVQAFAHDAIRPIIDDFTAETGIEVVLESGPATGQDLLTQLVPAFSSGSSPYDVIDADDPAGAALVAGGWLAPLPEDVYGEYLADLSPGMADGHEQWNVADGEHYRLYHTWDIGYTWVNEALLAEKGLSAPTTWDQLETVGAELKKDDIYVFADAASKPGLTFVYLAYLAAQAGGDLYAFDEGTREAWEFAKRLIDEGYFPQDAVTWTYDQSNAAFMADKVATMRQWPFFADVSKANTDWYAEDKAVITAPPAGPGGAKTWAGGWGMSIPKAAEHPAEAAAFVTYMNSPEVAVRLAQASSFFTTARTSVLDEMAGTSELVAAMKQYADGDHVAARPFHPQAAQAEVIIDEVGQAYLTGQIDLDTAMKQGAQKIEALG
jgi:multiple sugar transport system substrate-binding protein